MALPDGSVDLGRRRDDVHARRSAVRADSVGNDADGVCAVWIVVSGFSRTGPPKGGHYVRVTGRTMKKLSVALFALLAAAAPASAQTNLSGVWNNLGILNEDWPDRLPGPELGDYAG